MDVGVLDELQGEMTVPGTERASAQAQETRDGSTGRRRDEKRRRGGEGGVGRGMKEGDGGGRRRVAR